MSCRPTFWFPHSHGALQTIRKIGFNQKFNRERGKKDSKTTDHVTGCPSRKLKLFGSYCPFSPCAPFSQTSVFPHVHFSSKMKSAGKRWDLKTNGIGWPPWPLRSPRLCWIHNALMIGVCLIEIFLSEDLRTVYFLNETLRNRFFFPVAEQLPAG